MSANIKTATREAVKSVDYDINEEIRDEEIQESATQEKDAESQEELLGSEPQFDPNGKKSKEEWESNTPLFNRIKNLNKTVEAQQKALETLAAVQKQKEEEAYQRAKLELEAQRIEAIKVGDFDSVQQIEAQQKGMEVAPALKTFDSKYNTLLNGTAYEDIEIANFARARYAQLQNRNMTEDDRVSTVEKHMLKYAAQNFPGYFNESNELVRSERVVQAVEANTSSAVSGNLGNKKLGFADIPKIDRDVIEDICNNHHMDKEIYASKYWADVNKENN